MKAIAGYAFRIRTFITKAKMRATSYRIAAVPLCALPLLLLSIQQPFGAEITISLTGVPSYDRWGRFFCPADLNGDGTMDWVFRYAGSPNKLIAYSQDGTLLWSYNTTSLGSDNEHFSPYTCYDVDEDGKDEVYTYSQFTTVPEKYLVKLDPSTGEELKRVPFAAFGTEQTDVKIIIGYLDGIHPYVVTTSGCGANIYAIAYDRNLNEYWRFQALDSTDDWWGTAGHVMSCADLDGDGKDEVVLGAAALDDNGERLWSLFPGASYLPVHEEDPNPFDMPVWPPEITPNFFRHSDINFVGDIIPSHPGLEVWCGGEARYWGGVFDAATGEVVWARRFDSMQGVGFAGDIDPNIPGMELFCKEHNHSTSPDEVADELWDCLGNQLDIATYGLDRVPDPAGSSWNWSIWWNGSEHMQLMNIDGPTAGAPDISENFVGDVIGDWREEHCWGRSGVFHIITADGSPEMERPSLRTDRKYRTCLARGDRACGYFERPLPGQPLFDSLSTGGIEITRAHREFDAKILVRGKELKSLDRIAVDFYRIDGTRVLARDLSAGQSVLPDLERVGAGIYYLRYEANGAIGRQVVKITR